MDSDFQDQSYLPDIAIDSTVELGLEDDDWDLDDDFIEELQLRSHFIQHTQPSFHPNVSMIHITPNI